MIQEDNRKQEGFGILPSSLQMGEFTSVVFSKKADNSPNEHLKYCKVIGVHFYPGKVKYDLELTVCIDHDTNPEPTRFVTRIYNVDSAFVEPAPKEGYKTDYIPTPRSWKTLGEIPDVHPKDDEQSINVIIDINGEGEYFDTGWYTFEDKKWVNCNPDFSRAITEHPELVRWSYAPKD